MTRLVLFCLATAICSTHCFASDTESLVDKVNGFNRYVEARGLNEGQPSITADEVIASIRATHLEDFQKGGSTEETYRRLQKIAETEELPGGSEISHIKRLVSNGFSFDVWWVDLHLKYGYGGKTQWVHRIRGRTISSRPLTEQEREIYSRLELHNESKLSIDENGIPESPKPSESTHLKRSFLKGDIVTVAIDGDSFAEMTLLNKFSSKEFSETQALKIAAEVMAVQANGYLVIRGQRLTQDDNEKWKLVLNGIIRPDSFAPDGATVSTNKIAELKIDIRNIEE